MRPIMTKGCRSELGAASDEPGRSVNSVEGVRPTWHDSTMGKRALCVGVNKYPREDLELRGCVNDAKAWATLLRGQYDFASTDVKLLTDKQATKAKIYKALGDLLAGSKRGDVLVFTNSSHGTYRADKDGDESLLRRGHVPLRLRHRPPDRRRAARAVHGHPRRRPPDRHLRLLPLGIGHPRPGRRDAGPPAQAVARSRGTSACRSSTTSGARPSPGPPTCTRSRGCASCCCRGCRSDQYSYDARFGRRFHGAMTYHALGVIADAGGRITYGQLHKRLVPALRERSTTRSRSSKVAPRSSAARSSPDAAVVGPSSVILGAYSRRAGGGGRPLPRIVQVSIAPIDAHRFRVGIHEEGTGLSFRQDVDVPRRRRPGCWHSSPICTAGRPAWG